MKSKKFPLGLVWSNFNRLLTNPSARQVGSLYVAMILNIFLGIGVSIVNTRFLGPEAYGEFKLLGTLFTFVATITAFGFYNSAGRLLTQKQHSVIRRNIVGGSMVIVSGIALLIITILFAFSFFVDDLFHSELSVLLRLSLPLVFVFPFIACLENIFQGDNRIGHLSLLRVLPQLLYLCCALAAGYFFNFTLMWALLLQLGLMAAVVVGMVFSLKPDFSGLLDSLHLLKSENKSYGFHIFIGSVANVGSAQLLGLLIGYFVDPKNVGFYSLAVMVCMPLTLISSVFGTTFFKKFAELDSIPPKVFVGALISSLVVLFIFIVLIDDVIVLFYTEQYKSAINLAYILCFGFLVHGFGDIFNRFLGAHGKGQQIRNGAALTGLVAVVFGLLLTWKIGVTGAAIAKLCTSLVYFVTMCFFYIRRDKYTPSLP